MLTLSETIQFQNTFFDDHDFAKQIQSGQRMAATMVPQRVAVTEENNGGLMVVDAMARHYLDFGEKVATAALGGTGRRRVR
ncbi:unnamed protein product [Linum trigynum]|uniref:Uncharacterized protein n=1 Tax=Linum trigynum TaxID=586398 RepID=A0AAV2CB61_9ROSI